NAGPIVRIESRWASAMSSASERSAVRVRKLMTFMRRGFVGSLRGLPAGPASAWMLRTTAGITGRRSAPPHRRVPKKTGEHKGSSRRETRQNGRPPRARVVEHNRERRNGECAAGIREDDPARRMSQHRWTRPVIPGSGAKREFLVPRRQQRTDDGDQANRRTTRPGFTQAKREITELNDRKQPPARTVAWARQ